MNQLQEALGDNMTPTMSCPLFLGQGFNYTMSQMYTVLQTSHSQPQSLPRPRPYRQRQRFSEEQLAVMEAVFLTEANPKRKLRQHIADQIGAEEHRIYVWFTNRRVKNKKQMLKMGLTPDMTPIKTEPDDKQEKPQRAFLLPCVPNNTPVSSPNKFFSSVL